MVTGIKAAFLALTVFSIVVSNAQQWIDGVRVIQEWRKWRPRLRSYKSMLRTEEVKFLNTLEQLLLDVAISEDEVAQFINDPKSPLWKTETDKYAVKFQMQLGRSCEQFMETMIELSKILSTFCDKLSVASSIFMCLRIVAQTC